jgi:3-dehydroquinate synthase
MLNFFAGWKVIMDTLLARDKEVLAFSIKRSCLNKAEDEAEIGMRATLNLGHTFGHVIETGMGYSAYLHGEAVAIGICQATDLSRRKGWMTKANMEKIKALFKKARLPVDPPDSLSPEKILQLMSVDKKNVEGEIRLILLKAIGLAALPVGVDEILNLTLVANRCL